MEQVTHLSEVSPLAALQVQLRECFGRTAYSHKTHEKCADIYHGRLRILKIAQIALSAVTTTGLFVAIIGDNTCSAILAAIASTSLLALSTYTKEQDLGKLAQQHTMSAGDLWDVRESYLSLLADIIGGDAEIDRLRQKRDELQETLKGIYQAAPRTLPKAYGRAQVALQLNEELTFSEEEIDLLLPHALRFEGRK
ncbi:MAG: SLATT domain-containing protein [Kiritimatiellae bacterium]|nr:SLATT domain-containing protein [Kiritimatiellia bacterium]